MTEESHSSNQDDIQVNLNTYGKSKTNLVASLKAGTAEFNPETQVIVVDKELLERIEQSGEQESVGILKVGDNPKSLAYWQGRVEEIKELRQWLADKNIRVIGIEGIGGTEKSMLATKIYEEIKGFPKRFWADVSSGAIIFSGQ